MSNDSQKAELLKLFEKTHNVVEAFVASRSETDKSEPGTFKTWSAKDLLANIAFWMEYMVERMEYYRRAEFPPRYVDFDALHLKTYEANKHHSWQEILAYLEDSLNELMEEVKQFSEDELNISNVYGDVSEENQGGPLWGEIKANGFIYPLQEIEKFYMRKGEIAQATTVNTLLRAVIGETEKITVDLITVSALRKAQMTENPPLIIDVRDASEYKISHLSGAINIPLAMLAQKSLELPKNQSIITYCNMHHPQQSRSEQAALLLSEKGFHVKALEAGLTAWKDSGFPIEKASS